MNRLGLDAIDAGPLAESLRFAPDADAYTRPCLPDTSTPDQNVVGASGSPVPIEQLRSALSNGAGVGGAQRVF
jgi:hypothetical protein